LFHDELECSTIASYRVAGAADTRLVAGAAAAKGGGACLRKLSRIARWESKGSPTAQHIALQDKSVSRHGDHLAGVTIAILHLDLINPQPEGRERKHREKDGGPNPHKTNLT
jgi:hypothetical protein